MDCHAPSLHDERGYAIAMARFSKAPIAGSSSALLDEGTYARVYRYVSAIPYISFRCYILPLNCLPFAC